MDDLGGTYEVESGGVPRSGRHMDPVG